MQLHCRFAPRNFSHLNHLPPKLLRVLNLRLPLHHPLLLLTPSHIKLNIDVGVILFNVVITPTVPLLLLLLRLLLLFPQLFRVRSLLLDFLPPTFLLLDSPLLLEVGDSAFVLLLFTEELRRGAKRRVSIARFVTRVIAE